MKELSRRVLILDSDPDTLTTLQRVFQDAEIDVTVMWDRAEVFQLLETEPFDLILIEHHPPELDAATIIDELSLRGRCPSVLILRAIVSDNDIEQFHRLGATGIVPKRNPLVVLNEVKKALAEMPPKAKPLRATS